MVRIDTTTITIEDITLPKRIQGAYTAYRCLGHYARTCSQLHTYIWGGDGKMKGRGESE
jgi:hypothetical protein